MDLPAKKLVILGTQRTGSTLLCEDLRSYGVFGDPDEHFVPLIRRHEVAEWPERLAKLVNRRTINGVFSAKIMINYAHTVDQRLRESGIVPPQPEPSIFPHLCRLFDGATWMRIRRHDTIKQAVSREMSRQTGINHAADGSGPAKGPANALGGYTKDYNADAVLDINYIVQEVASIAMEEALIERYLQAHDLPCFTVWYEDYVADHQSILKDFASVFGTRIGDRPPERRLVKLYNEKNEHYVRLATEEIERRIRTEL